VFVVAVAANGVIGRNGALPWHLPPDLARFKRLTLGKPVVMGRRTFESIGRPLPGRHNIVLSRRPDFGPEGVTVVPGLAEAIAAAGLDPRARAREIMIIGGSEVFALALPIATRIERTEIDLAVEGDSRMPPIDPAKWAEVARAHHPATGALPAHDFVTLVRRPVAADAAPLAPPADWG
jgi:dihydrofolate reductase